MNDEELRDYLKRFCFGREHLICSRDLVRQKNLRESDLRKKVNRLRRKAVPIASSREGYFYASNAAELYSTIRQLKEMRAGLDLSLIHIYTQQMNDGLLHVKWNEQKLCTVDSSGAVRFRAGAVSYTHLGGSS